MTHPCTCGHVAVGLEVTDHREWHPECPEHGVTSTWWSLPCQVAERARRRAETLERQARAREARLRGAVTRRDGPPQSRG